MQNDISKRKHMTKIAVMMWVFAWLLVPMLNARQPRVEASLDTSNILIGDQINFSFKLQLPKGYHAEWPQFGDTLTRNIEILRRTPVDTIRLKDEMMQLSRQFTITSFDTGYYLIPTYSFRVTGNDQADTLLLVSEPFVLNVFSIPVDLSQPIKPIKGPLAVPYTIVELLPYILGAMALVALIVLLVTRKKKTAPVIVGKPKPKTPPHVTALTELEKLRQQKLWQQGFIKDYYSRLTEILRVYVEGRYSVPAIESTTYDTVDKLRNTDISKESLKKLQGLLEFADLVKFAKAKPLPSEHEQSINTAESFVAQTTPVASPSPVSGKTATGQAAINNDKNKTT